ncbi:tetratricopeptide repeat protein, partial [Micromonospora sp. KC207]|uniref:tetratricopeptide repeat protein n=1 Tax=Micromonospora sp. KC207 TaxID=2530377 RepID=UPI001046F935
MTALHDLAYTRQAQGDLDEAEQLFQQVREYRSDKLGRDHPNTLITVGLAEHHRTSVERHGLANDSPGQSIGHDQPRLASSEPSAEPADQGFSSLLPSGPNTANAPSSRQPGVDRRAGLATRAAIRCVDLPALTTDGHPADHPHCPPCASPGQR